MRMFLMVPASEHVGSYLGSLKEFPPARGSSLSLGTIMSQIQFAHPGQ
jgi:hypothetical protein